ncbi:MAG: N-acetylmuramoyl-L-alanine amidase [Spirochaetaceae bacterium]|jgi:N-acetylmuramoyl-L-alanine amidase|nr:N-acetylmuramoyl-L-alanine amidase [Spirochaetaceae bacterium]
MTGITRKHRAVLVYLIVFVVPGALSVPELYAAESALTLPQALTALGCNIRYNPLLRQGRIDMGGHDAAFTVGTRGNQTLVLFDNTRLISTDTPYTEGGALLFPNTFIASMKNLFAEAVNQDKERYRIAAVIIDPGHGGKDAGAQGTHTINGKKVTVTEKDVVLKVSQELYAALKTAYPDKKILMTRTGDTYPSLDDRTVIANSVPLRENEAIIYVSVHANASFNQRARGYEVWYLTPEYRRDLLDGGGQTPASLLPIQNAMLDEEFTKESVMIADSILAGFKDKFPASFPSRGIKAEQWYVVKNSKMPAVLVELGFVTNREDAILLSDPAGLKTFSDAIYTGLQDFIARFERSGGFIALK